MTFDDRCPRCGGDTAIGCGGERCALTTVASEPTPINATEVTAIEALILAGERERAAAYVLTLRAARRLAHA